MNGAAVAAIACGTNSTRLLVVDGGGMPLHREMRTTRLGQDVDAKGELAPEAIARTIAVLRQFRRTISAFGTERVRVAATSAARNASNRDVFLAAVEAAVGVHPELLGGDDEARLSFASATSGLDGALGPFLVIDIGGGSTEFAAGPARARWGEPEGVFSVEVGCVRVVETFLHSDPPTQTELAAAASAVRDCLDDVVRHLPIATRAAQLVVLAGPATAVSAVRQLLVPYGHGSRHFLLERAALESLFWKVVTAPRGASPLGPGMDTAVADVIVGGIVILVTTMRSLGFERCLVTEADILDGLVQSLLEAH